MKLFILFFIIFSLKVNSQSKSEKSNAGKEKVYSFQPLLIKGEKQSVKKAKNMKVKGEDIINSELFFIDIKIKDRIFDEAGLE